MSKEVEISTREEDFRKENFLNGAILNQRELCCCVLEWKKKAEDGNYKIPLSETSQKVLKQTLDRFYFHISNMKLPNIVKPFTSYEVNIEGDEIELGIVSHGKNVEFEADGYPIYPDFNDPNRDPNEEPTEDDESHYKMIYRERIYPIPVSLWEEWNDVKHTTAKSWIQKGRIQAYDDGTHNLRVSPIQYVPDALYENESASVRFSMATRSPEGGIIPQVLPDEIVSKYPALSGELIDIMVFGVDKSKTPSFNLFVVSRKEGEEKFNVHTQVYRADERKPLIRALNSVDGVRSRTEKYYHPPMGKISSGAKFRAAEIKNKDMNAVKSAYKTLMQTDVSSSTESVKVMTHSVPAFTLTFNKEKEETKEPLFKISGDIVKDTLPREETAEDRLLRAVLGDIKHVAIRERIFEHISNKVIDNPTMSEFPWNNHVLVIKDIEICTDWSDEIAKQLEAAFVFLGHLTENAFGTRFSLFAVSLPKDMKNLDKITGCMENSGFEELKDNGDIHDEVAYYAYG